MDMEIYYGIAVQMFIEVGMTDLDIDEVIMIADIIKEEGYGNALGCLKLRKLFYDLKKSSEEES